MVPVIHALRFLLVAHQLFTGMRAELKSSASPDEMDAILAKYQARLTELDKLTNLVKAQARLLRAPEGSPWDAPAYSDNMSADIMAWCLLSMVAIFGEPIIGIITPYINPRGMEVIKSRVMTSHLDSGVIASTIVASLANRCYLPHQSKFFCAILTSAAHVLQNRTDDKFPVFKIDALRRAYPSVKKLFSTSQEENKEDTFAAVEAWLAEAAQWITPTVDIVETLNLNEPDVTARVLTNTIADNPALFYKNFLLPV